MPVAGAGALGALCADGVVRWAQGVRLAGGTARVSPELQARGGGPWTG